MIAYGALFEIVSEPRKESFVVSAITRRAVIYQFIQE